MDRKTLRFCAKYPFTDEAAEKVLKGFELDNLNGEFIEKTEHRIETAVKGQDDPNRHRRMIEDAWEDTLIQEIVSYPLTKITASLTNDRYIKRKVAANEARKTSHYLDLEEPDTIREIAEDVLEVKETDSEDKTYKLDMKNYLNKKPRGDKYKLVNMPIDKGFIYLDEDDLIKLISSYVYNSVLNQEKPSNPPEQLQELSQEVKKYGEQTYTDADYGEADVKAFPPCMKKIYNDLSSGKEVGHQARFVLATFMVNIGMSMDQMLEPFRGQGNFDESKTRYHLEHAAGKKGGGTAYNAPSCSKIKSYGLCVSNCNTNHPLSYYKYRKKKLEEKGEEE